MPQIIQITNDIVNIGIEDGSILPVTRNELNFLPSLGDEVRIFRSETQTIVTKVEAQPQHQQSQQYQQYQQPPQYQQPQVVINNTNTNTNVNRNTYSGGRSHEKNKWVAFLLCLFLGFFGAHKFYEGKILMGIVYIFTGGLFCIGVIIDFFAILFKPNPYYV